MEKLLLACWQQIDKGLNILFFGIAAGFGLALGTVICIGLLGRLAA